MQLGRTRTHEGQIASSVGFFWKVWNTRHCTGTLLSPERYGGNQAVQNALDEQISLFAQIMTDDLAMQPAFGHLNQEVRLLIADMGVNMYFSWVYQWLKFDPTEIQGKQEYLNRCIKRAQCCFMASVIGVIRLKAKNSKTNKRETNKQNKKPKKAEHCSTFVIGYYLLT